MNQEWIRIKDKKPEVGRYIAGIRIHWPSYYWIGHYSEAQVEEEDLLTHWLPLPEPPAIEVT